MLISPAYAQTTSTPPGGEGILAFLPFILIIVIFYFLLIRPQQRRMKEQREMLAAIKRGDRIVVGGIIGTVQKVVDDQELLVEIAENTRVRVQRAMVATLVAKSDAPKDTQGGGAAHSETGKPGSEEAKPSGLQRFFGGRKS